MDLVTLRTLSRCLPTQMVRPSSINDAIIVLHGFIFYIVRYLTARVNADNAIKLYWNNLSGEGIEYDGGLKDRLLVGSTSTGAVVGVPNTRSSGVTLSEGDTFVYFQGGGSIPILAIAGIELDSNNPCWLWVAVRSTPIGRFLKYSFI